METTNLMIGDFVVYTEFGKNDIDKIETLEPRRVWLEHGKTYVPIKFIEPIPLTLKILYKIGFRSGIYGNIVLMEKGVSFSLIKGYEDDFWWTCRGEPIVKIKFFHELQHALRLCGIEKKIML